VQVAPAVCERLPCRGKARDALLGFAKHNDVAELVDKNRFPAIYKNNCTKSLRV
jgi:hypothetical protein